MAHGKGKTPCIGLFDSGIGGLSVLHACRRRAPGADYLYLGDNGHAPYGSRPREEISAFTRAGLETLFSAGADVAVLACNTATAVALEEMRQAFGLPIVGTEPAVRPAALRYPSVLVLCTPRTAASPRLARLLERYPVAQVCALPAFAAEIEAALREGREPDLAAHLPPTDATCIVLGCTHYALIKEQIGAFYRLPTFDGADGTARRALSLLGQCVDGEWSNLPKINKSSYLFEGPSGGNLVFLGEWGSQNAKIYEHLFKKP